jgi:hypothetical protein
MKIRHFLFVGMVVLLLVAVPSASWGLTQFPEKPPPDAGEEVAPSAAQYTLDHPLPTEVTPGQSTRSTTAGWNTLMTETFEGAFPSAGWTVYDYDGATNGEYYWDEDDYKPYAGSWSAGVPTAVPTAWIHSPITIPTISVLGWSTARLACPPIAMQSSSSIIGTNQNRVGITSGGLHL